MRVAASQAPSCRSLFTDGAKTRNALGEFALVEIQAIALGKARERRNLRKRQAKLLNEIQWVRVPPG